MAHHYIGLEGALSAFGGAKRRSGEDYVCLCPAHSDHKPSLYVKEGDNGIVLHCQVGCTPEAICAKAGIDMADLFRDPPAGSGRAGGKPRAKAPAKAPAKRSEDKPPARTYPSYEAAYGHIGRVERVYPYRDSRGALRFEVARIRLSDGDKTFRQHRPVQPDGSGKCAFPIRLDVPAELRETIIYRQPETEAAIHAGQTVYIVEGEKDADTMARLGLAATTNAGGGGKDRWKDGHTSRFEGAREVVILPDNDPTGEAHGEEVFRALSKKAKAVYLVRLRDGYPELKDKGDFTDLVEAVGDEAALEILAQLVDAARESLWQRAQRAYVGIPGYGIDHGRICQISEGVAKPLCNFVALPTEIVEIDDGLSVQKHMRVAGWNLYRKQLPTVLVPVAKFRSMDWVLEQWDVEANIMPGNTVKDKLRWCMTEAAFRTAGRRTVYSHCGWRRIDGNWVYLHQGGSIGMDGVEVDMGNQLESYTLSELPETTSAETAAMTSWSLTYALPDQIGVPMLGVTYLAPLVEFLDQVLIPPSFITALIGQHGTHKTTIVSLFLNHFGRFGIRGMPTNFTSTLNSIRTTAFAAKDTLLLIDDYFPATSVQERRKMENIMQCLSRAFGDKATRGRLNADLSAQAAKPARGMAVITGENVPDVGASGQARMYMINLDKSSYQYSDDMDKLWRDAEDGVLRLAMVKYIEWLLPQTDDLPRQLRDMFGRYRKQAHTMIAGAATNDRADDAVAHIMIGLTMFLRFMASLGITNEESVETQMREWWSVVISNVKVQSIEGRDESPVSMFMTAVREMLISGAITVVDISPGSENRNPDRQTNVGYCDGENYYFLPDRLFGSVADFYRRQDRLYPLSKNALFKIMREDGVIEQWDEKNGRSTRQKLINGRNARYLWIPRAKIDGRKEPEHVQQHMDEMTEVSNDPDNPFTD